MFNYIKGILTEILPSSATIEVSGIGFSIKISIHTYESFMNKLGNEVQLYQFLHVKEDDLTLYGFIYKEEREFFLKLISVSGVGPKKALEIINYGNIEEYVEAILNNDHQPFARVKGIGQKQAQKIILELAGKIKFETNMKQTAYYQLFEGLISLGFSRDEIEKAIDRFKKEVPEKQKLSFDEQFKTVLSFMSKF